MENIAIKEALSQIELFKELTPQEQLQLSNYFEVSHMSAGKYLFEENNPRRALFFIQQGEIELCKKNAAGVEQKIITFGKNECLGERAFIDDSLHSISAKVTKDVVLLVLNRRKLAKLFQEETEMAMVILGRIGRVISQRMQQTTNRIVNEFSQYVPGEMRTEEDFLGKKEIPKNAYYGIQTLRGLENFQITGVAISLYPEFIKAFAIVKMAAAKANSELNLIPKEIADAIIQAGSEITQGKLHQEFVLDLIQGGAGTSTNMNTNEVIANRALEILGHELGEYEHCSPHDHVNCSQSTNDTYLTAVKIAILYSNKQLIEVLKNLIQAFSEKGKTFESILKMGRTQLQDAVPMTLGQEFLAYAVTLSEEIDRLEENVRLFLEVNLGGTAIGTGINTTPQYRTQVIEALKGFSELAVVAAPNLVEATQDTSAFVMYSSALKRLAIKLSKICNDLRLLSSGPRAGLNEINLPVVQPGSTIMPGKVNPVIPEVVNQIAFEVFGNDTTVSFAAEAGQLQLNVMGPIIAKSIFESINILKNGMTTLEQQCIEGITANETRCKEYVQNSIGLATALNPVLGYETATKLAKEALEKNCGIYELVLEKKLLTQKELEQLLDPKNMTNS